MKRISIYILLISSSIALGKIPYMHVDNRSSTDFLVVENNAVISAHSASYIMEKNNPLLSVEMLLVTLRSLQTPAHTFSISAMPSPTLHTPLIHQEPKMQLMISYDSALKTSKKLLEGPILIIIYDANSPEAQAHTLCCHPYKVQLYIMNKPSFNVLSTE